MFLVRLLIVNYMRVIYHSVDWGQFVNIIDCGIFTCDYVLLFRILCSLIGTGISCCDSLFDIFPLGINYIVLTAVSMLWRVLLFSNWYWIMNFYFPSVFRMFCFIIIFFVVQWLDMVIISLFKFCARQPDICDVPFFWRRCSLEYDAASTPPVQHWGRTQKCSKALVVYYPFIGLKCHYNALYLCFVYR